MGVARNSGKPEAIMEELHLQFGVFFDGTLNNKRNAKVRIKVDKQHLTEEERHHLRDGVKINQ